MTVNETWEDTDISRPLDEVEVLVEVIARLLDNRDLLGMQLDHAHGNVIDNDRISKSLQTGAKLEVSTSRLREKVKILLGAVPCTLDSETISTVFCCSIGQAEQALASIKFEDELNIQRIKNRRQE